MRGITEDDLAIEACFTSRTLRNKLKHPETFKLGELRKISKALGFSDEEKADVL